ncbi:MAG TPA: hypothetical protein PKD32_01060 [Saprospiraceae bacterium]|jgi:hypothetical protein|nr:hypothetical protein [Saprospiraceae bacterium]MBX7164531.1 hypothetical protein [Saprospiraceae bacterium]HMS28417.1 hypothetical protein [Saprospiraceae bacterium]
MKKVNIEAFLDLENDLRRYRKALHEAQDIMLAQEISLFPIFIMHQQELEMGVPLIVAGPATGIWSVHASSLEEFVVKNIILPEKIDEFKKIYQDHDHHLCLFVLSEMGAQFIYFPLEEELRKKYGHLN